MLACFCSTDRAIAIPGHRGSVPRLVTAQHPCVHVDALRCEARGAPPHRPHRTATRRPPRPRQPLAGSRAADRAAPRVRRSGSPKEKEKSGPGGRAVEGVDNSNVRQRRIVTSYPSVCWRRSVHRGPTGRRPQTRHHRQPFAFAPTCAVDPTRCSSTRGADRPRGRSVALPSPASTWTVPLCRECVHINTGFGSCEQLLAPEGLPCVHVDAR